MPISPDKFPIPTTGQPIPKGWFGRLVRFMNSLILSGDESNLLVKRTDAGTTIALAPALLQKLNRAGTPGASGGGATGIQAEVSGGTASIALTGGTGSVVIQPGANVNITGGSNGEIIISATGGTAGTAEFWPDFPNPTGSLQSGYRYTALAPLWIFGRVEPGANPWPSVYDMAYIDIQSGAHPETHYQHAIFEYDDEKAEQLQIYSFCLLIQPGDSFAFSASGDVGNTQALFNFVGSYSAIPGYVAPADPVISSTPISN